MKAFKETVKSLVGNNFPSDAFDLMEDKEYDNFASIMALSEKDIDDWKNKARKIEQSAHLAIKGLWILLQKNPEKFLEEHNRFCLKQKEENDRR